MLFQYVLFYLFFVLAFMINIIFEYFIAIHCFYHAICKYFALAVATIFVRRMRMVKMFLYGNFVSNDIDIAIAAANMYLSESLMNGVCNDRILVTLIIRHVFLT